MKVLEESFEIRETHENVTGLQRLIDVSHRRVGRSDGIEGVYNTTNGAEVKIVKKGNSFSLDIKYNSDAIPEGTAVELLVRNKIAAVPTDLNKHLEINFELGNKVYSVRTDSSRRIYSAIIDKPELISREGIPENYYQPAHETLTPREFHMLNYLAINSIVNNNNYVDHSTLVLTSLHYHENSSRKAANLLRPIVSNINKKIDKIFNIGDENYLIENLKGYGYALRDSNATIVLT